MHATTRLLHEGEDRQARYGAINPPIYHASLFAYPTMQAFLDGMAGRSERYTYSRDGNPTVAALEAKDRHAGRGRRLYRYRLRHGRHHRRPPGHPPRRRPRPDRGHGLWPHTPLLRPGVGRA